MISMEQARVMRHGIALSGDRNQCGECGQLFNSTHAFEKHRTGSIGAPDPADMRRCMSVEEMKARGMDRNEAGFWVSARMPEIEREGSA
jgi:hypothetical protein